LKGSWTRGRGEKERKAERRLELQKELLALTASGSVRFIPESPPIPLIPKKSIPEKKKEERKSFLKILEEKSLEDQKSQNGSGWTPYVPKPKKTKAKALKKSKKAGSKKKTEIC